MRRILVAPLNWGLGHATRCIPIIRELLNHGFVPIIASDGAALDLLRKEFPSLDSVELPSYNVRYSKTAAGFKWAIIRNSPRFVSAVLAEKKLVKKLIADYRLSGIITDSRLGIVSKEIPSVLITHQLNVPFRKLGWISTKFHYRTVMKFAECWVPDSNGIPNLSGRLSHFTGHAPNIRYIGPLSRFKKHDFPKKYDLMAVISGPEPQRTLLQDRLLNELRKYRGNVLLINGIVEDQQHITQDGDMTIYNFMTSVELERAFNESEKIICRSGFTTLMDLSKTGRKALLIPTPGQYEQEYLAQKMMEDGFAPFANQDDFTIEHLFEINRYNGIPQFPDEADWVKLFSLFERK